MATPLVIENCEDAWNELVDVDVTASLDAADYKVGSGSAKFVAAAGLGAGDIIATEVISVASLAAYTHIGMWIKSSVALDAADLQLLLDNTAQCATPLESLDIPAVVADTWTFVTMALSAPASDLSLISIGLKQVVDKGAMTIRLDDIKAMWYGTTLRQQIMTAVAARLAGILVASGYETNLGENVFEWRDPSLQASELPALVYRDISDDRIEILDLMGADSHTQMGLTCEIELHGSEGSTTPATLRSMIADVISAIGTDMTWGGLALFTEYLSDETSVGQADKIMGMTTVRIRINYIMKVWDAYN